MFHASFVTNCLFAFSILSRTIRCRATDDGKIYFNGPIGRMGQTYSNVTSIEKMLELAESLNRLNSLDEFLGQIEGFPVNKTIGSRIAEGERSNGEKPQPANCQPQETVVELKSTDMDTSNLIYPSCTRVKRCGGCCNAAAYSCQPTETVQRNFQIIVSQVTFPPDRNPRIVYRNMETVIVEEHRSCACSCITKAKDCNENQRYIPNRCRCECTNVDEMSKCLASEKKIWNADTCSCACRDHRGCNTGSYYDTNSCSCRIAVRQRPWYNVGSREITSPSYTVEQTGDTDTEVKLPPVIYGLRADDPRRKPKEDPEYRK